MVPVGVDSDGMCQWNCLSWFCVNKDRSMKNNGDN